MPVPAGRAGPQEVWLVASAGLPGLLGGMPSISHRMQQLAFLQGLLPPMQLFSEHIY